MTDRPQMIVVGGPNGAGKTTFIKRLIAEHGFYYLGADQIAAEMRPDHPESVAFEAGREFVRIINELIDARQSFIVESTLSGRSLANTVERSKTIGYIVKSNCIFLNSPQESVARVSQRVRNGGHHVPTEDVLRRFSKSLKNFWILYRPLSDQWSLYYNGGASYVPVANSTANGFGVSDDLLFDAFRKFAGLNENDC
jgi:predicted ABC-type ATPase